MTTVSMRPLPGRIKLSTNRKFRLIGLGKTLLALVVLLPAPFGSVVHAQGSLAIRNSSTYVGNGRWNWKILVEADARTLNSIRCVEYTLHPTFPNPVRRVCNKPGTKFAYASNGWGTFTVKVRIIYKNGRERTLRHSLVFKAKPATTRFPITARNWAREIETGWYEWGVQLAGRPEDLAKIKCVEYTLHRSFPNPVRTVCTQANGFELKTRGWGTFTIPIKVLLRNGSVYRLKHTLKF